MVQCIGMCVYVVSPSWDSHYHCCPRCHQAHETHVMNNGVLFLHLSPFLFHPPTLFPLHPSFPLMLPLMLNLLSAASIWDGPFSFMQHRRPVWLGWLYGEEHGAFATLCWVISTQTTSFACNRFYVCPWRSIQALDRAFHILPSPSVYCLKSHRANWDRGTSGAEETWSHLSGDWTLLSAFSDPTPSLPPCLSPPHLCPLNFPASSVLTLSRCATFTEARGRAGRTWLKDEVSSQNWLGKRTAVRIRQWSVAF